LKGSEFIKYCFSHAPNPGDEWYWHEPDIFKPPFEQLAEILIFTFENAKVISQEYLPNQIGEGLSYILGPGSGYFDIIRTCKTDFETALAKQVFKSFEHVYDDIFEPLASPLLSHINQFQEETKSLNLELYMLGDFSGLQAPIWRQEEVSLHESVISIFEYGFSKKNIAVIESSIHALGHFTIQSQLAKQILKKAFDDSWPTDLKKYWNNAIIDNIQ